MASSALEATVRGTASPVREETRPKPAEKTGKMAAPVVNMSFYRYKQEFGTEPPFRSRKRTPKDIENEKYVDSLKTRMEQEDDNTRRKDDKLFVQSMGRKFGMEIEDEDTKRIKIIRKLNEEATIPPQIELNIQ